MRTVNDNSLVVALRYRGRAILFAGDLEAEGEDALVAAGLPRVDVVKVAAPRQPDLVVAGVRRRDPPAARGDLVRPRQRVRVPRRPAVVARWRAAGADVARTDTDGAITVTIDDAGDLAVDRFAPSR